MPSPEFIKKPPDGFSLLSIVRGIQLTVLGAYRSLQNPDLFRKKYYSQATYAILISIVIELVIRIPVWLAYASLHLLGIVLSIFSEDASARANMIAEKFDFIQTHLVNMSGLLIGLMRFFRPEMDDIFMESLAFIDRVYFKMHPDKAVDRVDGQEPTRFFGPLCLYTPTISKKLARPDTGSKPYNFLPKYGDAGVYVTRYVIRNLRPTAAYLLSTIPYVGVFVLPAISFYSFRNTVGTIAALVVFWIGFYVPREYFTSFLAAYWGARSLCMDLLRPYFTRVPFSRTEKIAWIRAREGVLFGFGFGFYYFLKLPYIGVMMYGIAESSAAYLITKVTDPPPVPEINSLIVGEWIATQLEWTKKKHMLEFGILENDGFAPVSAMAVMPGAMPGNIASNEEDAESINAIPIRSKIAKEIGSEERNGNSSEVRKRSG
ncbi:uncharacterized protein V1516DRAFT_695485 [Lipomyces oligophaga]|uniref:uncharacterized protein n=1 Tax=Lipomyces oligophaga TaxID=45792 RepID=UPI0034CDA325